MSELMNDHDLLVTLHQQMKQVSLDIQNLSTSTANTISDHERRIRALEENTLNRLDYNINHKTLNDEVIKNRDEIGKKFDNLSRYIYIGIGIILAIEFALGIYFKTK